MLPYLANIAVATIYSQEIFDFIWEAEHDPYIYCN
jgi:hypothetical protein